MNKSKREKLTPEAGQSWGIFGGAFDPCHNGHLNLIRQIRSIKGLNGVLLVPSINPLHRDASALSPFEDRFAMATLAVEDSAFFLVSSIECELNLSGFTIDTIQALKQTIPGVGWSLIVGADQAEVFDTWHQPNEILKEARLLVGARPGYESRLPKTIDTALVDIVPIPLVDLSSTEIRRQVAAGITESDLSLLVPPAVAAYITSHRLYKV